MIIYSQTGINLQILGPLLFLIFINDIADDMLGLCRLFADDTSVGERSLEINSVCSMVNIDLNNIKHWASRTKSRKNRNSVLQYQALSS